VVGKCNLRFFKFPLLLSPLFFCGIESLALVLLLFFLPRVLSLWNSRTWLLLVSSIFTQDGCPKLVLLC
jgi:hypothetical protein